MNSYLNSHPIIKLLLTPFVILMLFIIASLFSLFVIGLCTYYLILWICGIPISIQKRASGKITTYKWFNKK